MKVLQDQSNNKTYLRFKYIIKILTELKGRIGVIPILQQYLLENPSLQNHRYFVMPLAVNIVDYLRGIKPIVFFSTIINLAKVLSDIHDLNIWHRDIKPDNILVLKNQPVFSDFGLADFPNKKKVSNLNEKIGAKWTIAPEMARILSSAKFQKTNLLILS